MSLLHLCCRHRPFCPRHHHLVCHLPPAQHALQESYKDRLSPKTGTYTSRIPVEKKYTTVHGSLLTDREDGHRPWKNSLYIILHTWHTLHVIQENSLICICMCGPHTLDKGCMAGATQLSTRNRALDTTHKQNESKHTNEILH